MAWGPITKRNVNRAHTCAETGVKMCVLLSQVGQNFSHPCFMDELALWGSWPPAVLRPEFNSSDILNSLSTEVYIHGVTPPTKVLRFIIHVSLCWVSTSFYSTLILSFICCVCVYAYERGYVFVICYCKFGMESGLVHFSSDYYIYSIFTHFVFPILKLIISIRGLPW